MRTAASSGVGAAGAVSGVMATPVPSLRSRTAAAEAESVIQRHRPSLVFLDLDVAVSIEHRRLRFKRALPHIVFLVSSHEQTRPLLEYYRAGNLLKYVDGARDPEAIFKDIEKIVTSEKEQT